MSAQPTAASTKHHAQREFDAWSDSYDRSLLNHFLFRPSYVELMEQAVRWSDEHPGPMRILDIGCATGTFALMVTGTDLPVEAVGLDYVASMCLAASAKARRAGLHDVARFINADSEHLPFDDSSFDMVTCSNSFHHYPHQQHAVCEMRRVLRPGGRLVIIDGFRDNVIGWFVFDVVITRIEHGVYHAPWPVMDSYFRQAGLTNIRRKKLGLWTPVLATSGDVPGG